jgi:uncharacterized protein DUF2786
MNDTNRDKLLAKIKALFSKTVENGATEAEEMAAVEKARELVEKHQLDLSAEELKREGFTMESVEMDATQFAFARRIMNAIDDFCEVRTWYMTLGREKAHIAILGFKSDAQFARYLLEALANFAAAGAGVHIAAERKMAIALGTPMTSAESREMHRSYLVGCASRMSVRLREMTQQRKAQAAKPGSYGALVKLDKSQLIRDEMERLDIRLHSSGGLTGASDRGAFAAGSVHGGKATFGRPVAGGRVAGQIERK